MRRVRSAGAILYNPQGRILLQLRDDRPDLAFPKHWTTLGGAVEDGETADEAIRRELLEEIELAPEVRLWREYDYEVQLAEGPMVVDQYIYVGEIRQAANEIRLHEGQAVRYFGLDDLDGLPIAFGFEPLFRAFFEECL